MTGKMYLRLLTLCILLIACILLSYSLVELISVRQQVQILGEQSRLLERKHALESGQYHAQIGHILDSMGGLNSSGDTYSEGNDGETTTTDQLDQEIQAKVNTTVQAIQRSVELFKHTTNKQMQVVLRDIRNEKLLRNRSAERVMDQLHNHIQKLVMTMTDRFDEQDTENQELMKQVNNVIVRITTVHKNLKDEMITDVNDMLRHYGNRYVLDNAVVLKTIEDTVNASQYHSNDIQKTFKTIVDSLTNLTGMETCPTNRPTCPPYWIPYPCTNSCYKFFPTQVTFDVAVQNCIDVNSHITDIGNDLENYFVASLADNNQAWMGLTDEGTEDVWRWKHNNQSATYVKWRPDPLQPDGDTNQNCCIISWDSRPDKHWWHDWVCSKSEGYICKMVLPQTC